MGFDRTAHTVAEAHRASAQDGLARGCERAFVYGLLGRSVAASAQDFPPFSTVQKYFYRWRDGGLLRTINSELVMAAREREGREASPTAGVIDSQSVKTSESGGIRGFDAGKIATNFVCAEVLCCKRHIVVDTLGLLVGLVIHAADIQDRDGAPVLLQSIVKRWPWLRHVFADGGYAGPKLRGSIAKDRGIHAGNHQALGHMQRLRNPAAPMGG